MRFRRETLIAAATSLWALLLHVVPAAYANGGLTYAACATLVALGDIVLRRREVDGILAGEPAADTVPPLPANVLPFARRVEREQAANEGRVRKAA